MRAPLHILLLLPALLLPSCSKHKEDSSPRSAEAQSLVHIEPVETFERAQAIVGAGTIACDDKNQCPASVAMYMAADTPEGFSHQASVASCTAFLVGPDLALTNSHCIPNAVKLMPDLCAERIRLVFPATGAFSEEAANCQALLGFSERKTSISPDLALLRLEHAVSRPAFPLSREGLAPGAYFATHKIARVSGTLTGTLRSERCLAINKSYRMPIYRERNDPVFVLGDCSALPGNSGSPVVGSDGSVAGVMQAELPLSPDAQAEWGRHLADGQAFSPLAMGTSLSCLLENPPAWSWNSACPVIEEVGVALARPRIRQFLDSPALTQQKSEALAPFLTQSQVLALQGLEIETKSLTRQETLAPRCIRPVAEWKQNYPGKKKGRLLRTAGLRLDLPVYEMELRFNRYLQTIGTRVTISRTDRQSYRFHPAYLAANGYGILTPLGGPGEPLRLKLCGDEAGPAAAAGGSN